MEDSDDDLFGDAYDEFMCDNIEAYLDSNQFTEDYCFEISTLKILSTIRLEKFSCNSYIYDFKILRNNANVNTFTLQSYHSTVGCQPQVYVLLIDECLSDCSHEFCIIVDQTVFNVLHITPPGVLIALPNGALYACSIEESPICVFMLHEPIFSIKSFLAPVFPSAQSYSFLCVLTYDCNLLCLLPCIESVPYFKTCHYNLPIGQCRDIVTKFGHKLWHIVVLGNNSLVGVKVYLDGCDNEIKCTSTVLANITGAHFYNENGEYFVADHHGNIKTLSRLLNNYEKIEDKISLHQQSSCEEILHKIQCKTSSLNSLQKRNHYVENVLRQMDLICYLKQISADKLMQLLPTSVNVRPNGNNYDLEIVIENNLDTRLSVNLWFVSVDIHSEYKSSHVISHIKQFKALRRNLKEQLVIAEFLSYPNLFSISRLKYDVSVRLFLCPSGSFNDNLFSKSVPPFLIILSEKRLTIVDFFNTISKIDSLFNPAIFPTVASCMTINSSTYFQPTDKQFTLNYEINPKSLPLIQSLLNIDITTTPQMLYLYQKESHSICLKLMTQSAIQCSKDYSLLTMTSNHLPGLFQLFCTIDNFVKSKHEAKSVVTKEYIRQDFVNLQNTKLALMQCVQPDSGAPYTDFMNYLYCLLTHYISLRSMKSFCD